MKKYKVELSTQAKSDYKDIIHYIKHVLLEPNTAKRYAKIIKDELISLEYQPNRNTIIDYDVIKQYQYRKLIIKSYIAFYRIDETKKVVNVDRILYGASNWKSKL